ncbi:hypothetical protein PIB30_037999 [Stylosanthes scabra]|uniref:Transposase MuDR plant domain-containing protein n=1 Tax=Stylosanthes scabra TaxID=79078 RepID=A0ABU6QEK0_9FABA|nr:hypothetical protein [Stylosanthes scabra]
MYEATENDGDEIEVFTKHPISVPVVAEVCVPDAGVTNDSPPITPSKGRKKVRARRTPILNKAHFPKRSLLLGEESAVPLTNHAPFSSSKVHTAGSESTQPQNLNKRSSGSNRMPNSSEVPSNELFTQYVPIPQHCYESEELNSIASDDDNQPHVFPQGNPDAPTREIRLKLEMEFETIKAFQKVVRKFNIHLGRNIFFPRVDSEKCKAICDSENCPWQIYYAK